MKRFAPLLLIAGLFASSCVAQTRPTTRPQSGASVETSMKAIQSAFKSLKAQYDDPSKMQSTMQLVAAMQTATLDARNKTPQHISRQPADQQAESLRIFRAMMMSLLRHELELEERLEAGEYANAADIMKEIDDLQDKGHQEFDVQVHE